MKYYKKMIGKKCYLSPLCVEDAEKFIEWVNDEDVFQNVTFGTQNISLQTEKDVLEQLSKRHAYAIVSLEDDTLLGSCELARIDNVHRTAELGIIIGNKAYWNQGIGTEAIGLLLQYGFNYLNLRNVMLRVLSFNERAIACYKKIGFKEIGHQRKAITMKQKEYDIIYMDILNDEFVFAE